MSEEKKLALLIDSDNVSAKYAQFILQEASKYGELSCKRVYGDWEKNNTGWRLPAMNNSILPVQQTCYVTGKNATDFSMIIDAMDLLYGGCVDGFVLVTSDSDFTRLAIRLREAGKLVVGIGEVKTPLAFTSSCHHFSYLNQVCDNVGEYDEKSLRKAVLDYVKENDDKRLDLGKIDSFITSKFGNVDFNLLGFNRLSSFIDSFPELRRNNTFVSVKKKNPPPVAPVKHTIESKEIESAIVNYLKENGEKTDNMLKIESYLNSIFGKIDYSRFGSKRFAKFIDKLIAVKRVGTSIMFAETKQTLITVSPITAQSFRDDVVKCVTNNMPAGVNIGQLNNILQEKYGKGYLSDLGFADFAAALSSIGNIKVEKNYVLLIEDQSETEKIPEPDQDDQDQAKKRGRPGKSAAVSVIGVQSFEDEVVRYASENMPTGGNLGQLNNMLLEKYGKDYVSDLGFADFAAALSSVSNVRVAKNNVFLIEDQPGKEKAPEPARDDQDQAKKRGKSANEKKSSSEDAVIPETETPKHGETPSDKPEKAEINTVKRDILSCAAQNENGVSLPALGKLLSEKYGKNYLKELGFSSMKKLVSEISGVTVKDNRLSISEEFLSRTDEIEQFVYDFARGEGSRSIKALSSGIKKRFPGFDFSDYGYAKFSDFINAIDGVRANGYYVEPDGN